MRQANPRFVVVTPVNEGHVADPRDEIGAAFLAEVTDNSVPGIPIADANPDLYQFVKIDG